MFKKGQENLAINNAEDAVWWFFIYGYEYGIDDKNYNGKKDFFDRTKQEQDYIQEILYNNAMRIMQIGVKGVDFGEQEKRALEKYKDYFLSINENDKKNINIYEAYIGYYKQNKDFISNGLLIGRKLVLLSNILQQTNFQNECESIYINDYINLSIEMLKNKDYIDKFVKNQMAEKIFTDYQYTFFDHILHHCEYKYGSKIKEIKKLIKENIL